MKVLVITHISYLRNFGGTELMSHHLALNFRRSGIQADVLDLNEMPEVNRGYTPAEYTTYVVDGVAEFLDRVKAYDLCILASSYNPTMPYYAELIAGKIPYIVVPSLHDSFLRRLTPSKGIGEFPFLVLKSLHNASLICASSTHEQEFLEPLFPRSIVCPLPLYAITRTKATSRAAGRRELGIPETALVLLFIGRGEHGLSTVEHVARQLRRHRDVVFVLVTPSRQVSSPAGGHHRIQNTLYFAHISEERKGALVDVCDVFFRPSPEDSFCIAAFEAAAKAKALILLRTPVFRALFADNALYGQTVPEFCRIIESLRPRRSGSIGKVEEYGRRARQNYSALRKKHPWRSFVARCRKTLTDYHGRKPPRPAQKGKAGPPLLSIIIVTFKPSIYNVLDSLNRQDFPLDRLEVIVVDNAFEKRTLDCSAYGFRVIRTPPLNGLTFRPAPARYRRYNFSTARNTGIHLSSGAVLLFLDDDIHLAGDSLRIRYEMHQCYPHAVIGGPRHDFDRRILSEGNAPGLDRLIHQSLDPDVRHFGMNGMLDQRNYYWNTVKDRLHEVTRFFSHTPYFNFIIGGNMSAEKSDLLGINGFDERYNGAYGFEDIDCCRRLVLSGANAVYCLSCAVFHENHSNTVKRFTPTIYSKNKILYRSLDIHALAANQGRWWWNKDSLLPITVSFEELSSCFRGFGVESFGELHRDTPGNAHIRFNRFPLHDPPSFLDGICESAEYSAQAALPRIAVNRLYPESTRVERRFVREFHKLFGYFPPVELVNRHTRSATCLDEALLGFLQSRDYYYNALYQSLFAGGREL